MAKEDALSYPRDNATSFTGLPAINHARALTTQARCRQAENDRPSCFRKWRRKVLGLINSALAQRAAGSWIEGLSKSLTKRQQRRMLRQRNVKFADRHGGQFQ